MEHGMGGGDIPRGERIHIAESARKYAGKMQIANLTIRSREYGT